MFGAIEYLRFYELRPWKNSPDGSGYAILSRGFCGVAIAFERTAGGVFPRVFIFRFKKIFILMLFFQTTASC